MADQSTIEWTETTWNPVTGCDRVSPGCAHCYALTLAGRLKAMGQPRYQQDGDPKTSGPGFGVTLHEDLLERPLRWRKPRTVFVNSMSDLFHEVVPDEFIARVFGAMAAARRHTFQVLTKRPERMASMLNDPMFWAQVSLNVPGERDLYGEHFDADSGGLRNVWLGVSIENRRFVHRAELLRRTPAAVRFVSAEPLLGPLVPYTSYSDAGYGAMWHDRGRLVNIDDPGLDLAGIDWLIVGGESGPKHRPMHVDWARDLRDAAREAGTAFFFKQHGGHRPKSNGRLLDGRTWDETPAGATVGVPRGQLVGGGALSDR